MIVEAALETKQMGNPINNSNLPRPASEEDPDYDRWVTASKLVKFRLLSHLDSEIMTETRNKYPFADSRKY
jgi:hypothetical protein